MSAPGRFAPITAQLLARKGEAVPLPNLLSGMTSLVGRPSVVDAPVHDSADVPEIGRMSGPSPTPRRRHSIALSVTDEEFEKLGLAAVKKRINKQQLLRLAIDHYLGRLGHEYRAECRCISSHTSCSSRTVD